MLHFDTFYPALSQMGVIGEHNIGSAVFAYEFSKKKNRERERWMQMVFESKAQLASSCASTIGPVHCINFVDTCNFNRLSKQV